MRGYIEIRRPSPYEKSNNRRYTPMKRAVPTTSVPEPKTKAMVALEENLDSIMHMLALSHHEAVLTKVKAVRAIELLDSAKLGRDMATKQGQEKFTHELKRLSKSLETIGTRLDRFLLLTLWQIVMLVTCVEAYLQDVLAAAASIDPELMIKSEQSAPYADVIAATSLEALANELRAGWARNWLSNGGPTRWISRLEKMGARDYPPNLGPRLELFWGIRHVVIHAAGVATADFVKRHPGVVPAAGNRVRANHKYLQKFVEAIPEFIEPTEKFFLKRYPAMAATIPSKIAK